MIRIYGKQEGDVIMNELCRKVKHLIADDEQGVGVVEVILILLVLVGLVLIFKDQIVSLSNLSMLGNFVGMLTDSRSFLSYTRHDYFRRILCRTVGEWVENGEYPRDEKNLERIIKGISYNNAVEYFGFKLEKI